jgi:DNA-binding transcriptional LysR family regulator
MTHPGRQTLLFSATMPTAVAEFTRAGLKDPEIIRLDAENKISDKLDMTFIRCRDDEKDAALLFLVKHHIPATSRSIIFAPTKHHVECVLPPPHPLPPCSPPPPPSLLPQVLRRSPHACALQRHVRVWHHGPGCAQDKHRKIQVINQASLQR